MDNFMDKIAQKLGAQEAIRANAAADAAQMEKLEAQVAQYDACMKEMRKLNLKNVENEEKVGAIIEVKVAPQRGQGFDRIAERIYKFDEVSDVYLVSGSHDLTVVLEGKSMREIANFVSDKLSPLEAVLSTSTNFVLKKYKEHGLPLVGEAKQDERMLITP